MDALGKALEAHEAAQASLKQPFFLQQPYWCDGLGASASALDAWVEAGLPLRAVVHLKAPKEGEQTQDTLPLVAGTALCTAVLATNLYTFCAALQLADADCMTACCCRMLQHTELALNSIGCSGHKASIRTDPGDACATLTSAYTAIKSPVLHWH